LPYLFALYNKEYAPSYIKDHSDNLPSIISLCDGTIPDDAISSADIAIPFYFIFNYKPKKKNKATNLRTLEKGPTRTIFFYKLGIKIAKFVFTE
jgi:hypothetical protein